VEAVTAEEAAGGVAGVVLMGGRWDSVSLGLLEENERKGRGLPRFGFAREGVVPCGGLLRGRRKSRGGERCVRAVRVCGSVGGCRGDSVVASGGPGREKKKRKGRLFSGKPGRKSLFCANFELSFSNRLSMKIDPIYRAGQRVISSSMGKTSQPLIRLE